MILNATLTTEEVLEAVANVFAANGYAVNPEDITINEDYEAIVRIDTSTVAKVKDKPKTKAPTAVLKASDALVGEPDTSEDTDADNPPFDTDTEDTQTEVPVETAEEEKPRNKVFGRVKRS